MEGPWRHFEEKREPVSDIDTAAADSLKAIREADMTHSGLMSAFLGEADLGIL